MGWPSEVHKIEREGAHLHSKCLFQGSIQLRQLFTYADDELHRLKSVNGRRHVQTRKVGPDRTDDQIGPMLKTSETMVNRAAKGFAVVILLQDALVCVFLPVLYFISAGCIT